MKLVIQLESDDVGTELIVCDQCAKRFTPSATCSVMDAPGGDCELCEVGDQDCLSVIVPGCGDCPLRHGDDTQEYCWIDELGDQDGALTRTDGKLDPPPDWCPLRRGPASVVLRS